MTTAERSACQHGEQLIFVDGSKFVEHALESGSVFSSPDRIVRTSAEHLKDAIQDALDAKYRPIVITGSYGALCDLRDKIQSLQLHAEFLCAELDARHIEYLLQHPSKEILLALADGVSIDQPQGYAEATTAWLDHDKLGRELLEKFEEAKEQVHARDFVLIDKTETATWMKELRAEFLLEWKFDSDRQLHISFDLAENICVVRFQVRETPNPSDLVLSNGHRIVMALNEETGRPLPETVVQAPEKAALIARDFDLGPPFEFWDSLDRRPVAQRVLDAFREMRSGASRYVSALDTRLRGAFETLEAPTMAFSRDPGRPTRDVLGIRLVIVDEAPGVITLELGQPVSNDLAIEVFWNEKPIRCNTEKSDLAITLSGIPPSEAYGLRWLAEDKTLSIYLVDGPSFWDSS